MYQKTIIVGRLGRDPEMRYVPWFAVYKGDFLWIRVDAAGLTVYYEEEK